MSEPITDIDYILGLFDYAPSKRTIEELVIGADVDGVKRGMTGFPASRVRKAMGELYGLGFVKVVEVVDGVVYWGKTTSAERCGL